MFLRHIILVALLLSTLASTGFAQSFQINRRSFNPILDTSNGSPVLRVGRAEATLVGEISTPPTLETQVVRVSAREEVAVLSVGQNHRVIIRSRRNQAQIVWFGQTVPHGDLGERVQDIVQIADRTGDGFDNIIVGHSQEGRSVCGQTSTLLDAQAYDPARGELVPVTLPRAPDASTVGVQATLEAPGISGEPIAPILRARNSSSRRGGEGPPVRLIDGDLTTAWVEARPGLGRFEFATMAVDGGLAIRAIRLVLQVAGTTPVPFLWLVTEHQRIRVEFPSVPTEGQPWWVVPPVPLEGRCLSVVLGNPPADHAGIAELTAYTELDAQGGGADILVGRLARGPAESQAAANLLVRIGDDAVPPLQTAFVDMTERERAITASVFARIGSPIALTALATAIRATPALRDAAIHELQTRRHLSGLTSLSETLDPPDASHAAAALATLDPAAALPITLALLARGARGRAWVRAFSRVASSPDAAATIDAFAQTVEINALSILAELTARSALQHGLSVAYGRANEAETFAQRFRFATAAVSAPSEQMDTWLTSLLNADEWMLRGLALNALGGRLSRDALERAFSDEMPRVRATAAGLATEHGWATRHLGALFLNDSWAFVRIEALTTLVESHDGETLISRALRDHHELVRAAAIHLYQTHPLDDEAVLAINASLANDREWPVVFDQGVELAAARCDARLAPGLESLLERALVADATARDVDLGGEALAALVSLAKAERYDVTTWLERASSPAAPEALHGVARAAANAVACRPTPTS